MSNIKVGDLVHSKKDIKKDEMRGYIVAKVDGDYVKMTNKAIYELDDIFVSQHNETCQAWVNGKAIEFFKNDRWVNIDHPFFSYDCHYRISPTHKYDFKLDQIVWVPHLQVCAVIVLDETVKRLGVTLDGEETEVALSQCVPHRHQELMEVIEAFDDASDFIQVEVMDDETLQWRLTYDIFLHQDRNYRIKIDLFGEMVLFDQNVKAALQLLDILPKDE